jgi:hypothetical protein
MSADRQQTYPREATFREAHAQGRTQAEQGGHAERAWVRYSWRRLLGAGCSVEGGDSAQEGRVVGISGSRLLPVAMHIASPFGKDSIESAR